MRCNAASTSRLKCFWIGLRRSWRRKAQRAKGGEQRAKRKVKRAKRKRQRAKGEERSAKSEVQRAKRKEPGAQRDCRLSTAPLAQHIAVSLWLTVKAA